MAEQIETTMSNLAAASAEQVGASQALASDFGGMIAGIDNSVANAIASMEEWKDNAQAVDVNAQPQYTQDITIGGSIDFLYPVWFRLPYADREVAKITILRLRNWNGEAGERPFNPDSTSQAGVLLEMEGHGSPIGGGGNFLQIKRFSESFNSTVSHVQFGMQTTISAIDLNAPVDFASPGPSFVFSGLYLRGGGLKYRIVRNVNDPIYYHNGDDPNEQTVIDNYLNSRFTVHRIPIADLSTPIADTTAF